MNNNENIMNNEKQSKQLIVMRSDLNMRKGKIASQAAHSSMSFLTRSGFITTDQNGNDIFQCYIKESKVEAIKHWLNNSFAKICVQVPNEQTLLDIHRKALEIGLISYLVTDNGKTEFNGVPTHTCCAIGPDWNENIDAICKELKLY